MSKSSKHQCPDCRKGWTPTVKVAFIAAVGPLALDYVRLVVGG